MNRSRYRGPLSPSLHAPTKGLWPSYVPESWVGHERPGKTSVWVVPPPVLTHREPRLPGFTRRRNRPLLKPEQEERVSGPRHQHIGLGNGAACPFPRRLFSPPPLPRLAACVRIEIGPGRTKGSSSSSDRGVAKRSLHPGAGLVGKQGLGMETWRC